MCCTFIPSIFLGHNVILYSKKTVAACWLLFYIGGLKLLSLMNWFCSKKNPM